MADSAYEARLVNRGKEKLAEHPLVESFEATVKTHNPTYQYGTDYLLGDTITITDERLNVSVSAVVTAREVAIVNGQREERLSFGFSSPTLAKVLSRKGEK